MSVVNSAFALKRAWPLGSCVPFERFKATEVASYQSWEWRCKPLWLARRAPPPTLRTKRRPMPTLSRRSEFPSASWSRPSTYPFRRRPKLLRPYVRSPHQPLPEGGARRSVWHPHLPLPMQSLLQRMNTWPHHLPAPMQH